MSPAEGLKAIAVDLALLEGITGWRGFVGGTQDLDKNVGFLDTGGVGGEVKVAIDYPTVQAIVLGKKGDGGYHEAYTKARQLYDALLGIDTPVASWPNLVSCIALNQPVWLGRSDVGRPIFSLNFRLIVTPEDIGNRPY